MADGCHYVLHHLQIRDDGVQHQFHVFETEKESLDQAIEVVKWQYKREFNEQRTRGLLVTDPRDRGDSIWIPKDIKKETGDRLTIMRTWHPERYCQAAQDFLNFEMRGCYVKQVPELHWAKWIE